MRLAIRPAAWAALALLQGAAWAQSLAEQAPLRTSPRLEEPVSDEQRRQAPTFVSGERISGQQDLVTVVEGDAELRRADTLIRADRLEYHQPEDLAKASGHVRINRAGDVFEGTRLELYVDAFEGFFLQPTYRLLRNQAHGEASRVDFAGDKRAVVHDATYTTCLREPGPSWMPDWILRADSIAFDQEAEVAQAEGALLSFKGVPVMPIPSFSFPLSDRRKSGVLPPTLGIDNLSGFELTLPYYWDIAPNRDATFSPTFKSKRGIDLGTEFRYLENDYRGQARLNLMPGDRLRDRDRWGYSLQHQGSVNTGWASLGALGLNLNLNRVSDDNYWRDFPRAGLALSQRLLPSDGQLSWARGDVSFNARAQKWQTLQDVTAPIVPPYDRMPQLAGRWARYSLGGFDVSLDADTTRFEADFPRLAAGLRPNQPNGQRSFVLAQASRPWVRSWGFVTPKLQLHATHYQFDAALASGQTSASRSLPTFSLDSGLVFERDARLFDRALRQTLEPRAFYTRTPLRDQSHLPNYDSGANDFNFATIYTENAFVGHDRIADNNLLTLGVTTRLLDPDSGAEAARLGLAQRLRFADQNVTLPGGQPVSERLSDLLLGAAINWDPRWGFDGTVQYNPKTHRSIRTTLGARYRPGTYRVLNLAYRLQRGTSEQLDLGWQWPIAGRGGAAASDRPAGRWYSVGRLNYSLQDRKLVDAILGVEYDACCWIARVVLERLQSTTTTANTRILFQLEFVGFSSIGTSPLKTLRDNIRGYQELRSQSTTPSRFSNYD